MAARPIPRRARQLEANPRAERSAAAVAVAAAAAAPAAGMLSGRTAPSKQRFPRLPKASLAPRSPTCRYRRSSPSSAHGPRRRCRRGRLRAFHPPSKQSRHAQLCARARSTSTSHLRPEFEGYPVSPVCFVTIFPGCSAHRRDRCGTQWTARFQSRSPLYKASHRSPSTKFPGHPSRKPISRTPRAGTETNSVL